MKILVYFKLRLKTLSDNRDSSDNRDFLLRNMEHDSQILLGMVGVIYVAYHTFIGATFRPVYCENSRLADIARVLEVLLLTPLLYLSPSQSTNRHHGHRTTHCSHHRVCFDLFSDELYR